MKISRLHKLIALSCGIALAGGGISMLARAGIVHPLVFWVCIVPLSLAAMRTGVDLFEAFDDEGDDDRRR